MNHSQEIDNLRNELERVKKIAGDRLDKIVQLQSELKYEKGVSAQQRRLAGQLALELAQLEDDPRRLEDSDDDSDTDHGGLWGAHCRGELA